MSEHEQPLLFADLPGARLDDHDTTLTPLSLLNRMGPFDLDPCAFPDHATATNLICWPEDGLQAPWNGRVWLNPPYSDPGPWLARLLTHGDGMALVLASTDTKWFHDYAAKATALLFIQGRPLFLRNDFTEVGLMRASVLVAFGEDNAARLSASGIAGWFARTNCPDWEAIPE